MPLVDPEEEIREGYANLVHPPTRHRGKPTDPDNDDHGPTTPTHDEHGPHPHEKHGESYNGNPDPPPTPITPISDHVGAEHPHPAQSISLVGVHSIPNTYHDSLELQPSPSSMTMSEFEDSEEHSEAKMSPSDEQTEFLKGSSVPPVKILVPPSQSEASKSILVISPEEDEDVFIPTTPTQAMIEQFQKRVGERRQERENEKNAPHPMTREVDDQRDHHDRVQGRDRDGVQIHGSGSREILKLVDSHHRAQRGVNEGHITTSIGVFRISEVESEEAKFTQKGGSEQHGDVEIKMTSQKGEICDGILICQDSQGGEDTDELPPDYKVGASLKYDWKVQATFVSKIVLIKAVQLLAINIWILLVGVIEGLTQPITSEHDWLYMPLGIFGILFLFVRLVGRKRSNWHPLWTFIFFVLMTFCLAYPLAAVTHTYKVYCVPMATGSLFLTLVTMSCVPYVTKSIISKPAVVCTGIILVIVYSVGLLVACAFVLYDSKDLDLAKFATTVWFPGVIIAEITLWVMLLEIQRIIQGYCFNVSEYRWFFSALYL